MPLTGRPMLSTSVAISRRNDLRIAFSMSAKREALSSTRVPTWARACIRIWPASTDGKKLRPRNGTSRNDASDEGQEADRRTTAVRRPAPGQQVAVAAAHRSKRASKPRWKRTSGLRDGGAASLVVRGVRLQQVVRHRRHQRARQDERADHREHHRFGHRHEQEARHAVRKNIGTNTMQMHSSETKAGVTICARRP
jgi:hypothetical protein